MNRTLASIAFIVAAGLAPAPALAQSGVTLYGVADVFIERGQAGTQASRLSRTRVESGGLNGSRLGLRDTEDLGSGLKATMVIEHGLLLDSGVPASTAGFWNRQAFAGLSGPWGSLTAGRQYSPLLVHQDTFDTALSTTGYGSPYNSGVMRTVSRVNNSVVYSLPADAGFSASLMAAAGEGSAGSTWSASLRRAEGAWAVGMAGVLVKRLDGTTEDKRIWNLAASYRLGDAMFAAALQRTRNDRQAANTEDDRNELFLGASCAVGTGELRAAYGQGTVRHVAGSTARHASLGYVHHLSKRTALYTAVQQIDNPDNLAYRSEGFSFDAIAPGLPAGAGVTARAVAAGVRHRF